MGDDKRGRRDEKPTKVDPKRITSLLRRGGERSKDVSSHHLHLCIFVFHIRTHAHIHTINLQLSIYISVYSCTHFDL